ncbi:MULTISPECIES: RDD family protein [Corynebacterium]|uniref:RDD family protein n=1 Tax=Corynebacterium ramonii TaxID=3026968 RepID=A0ABM5RSV1_9CORY|nr:MULTISPECIES: RDD family protein [Corynebacterium]AIU33110.1 Hypothetical protein CulFRC11_1541 [Corynebacterium ramonii FRC0011]ESU57927.1 membrane protein [Corynebacterium ulcerans NCTC 12077]STC83721.1 hypothetical membrane protein [Corynebacterium ulcerans]
MAKPKRSWLDGPEIPSQIDGDTPARWPGENLGLPQKGPGALGSVLRRSCGVLIDWGICLISATVIHMFTPALGGVSTATLILFFILGVISVWLFARTPGQAILGMGVARIDVRTEKVGFVRALVRTALTCFIFPAVLVDADGRGMHDRATGTAVVFG